MNGLTSFSDQFSEKSFLRLFSDIMGEYEETQKSKRHFLVELKIKKSFLKIKIQKEKFISLFKSHDVEGDNWNSKRKNY